MNYRVIKENDMFLLTDESGQIPDQHPYGPGLYTKDTRFLSRFDLRINGEEPVLLASDADNTSVAEMLLTNPHMEHENEAGEKVVTLWRESIEMKRRRFIWDGVLYEQIHVKSYHPQQTAFNISLQLDADFKDMFVVRGFQNGRTGNKQAAESSANGLKMSYLGADDVQRQLHVTWNIIPESQSEAQEPEFHFDLAHGEEKVLELTVVPEINGEKGTALGHTEALERLTESTDDWAKQLTKVQTDYEPLQRLIDRGLKDLRVLLTDLGEGSFPVAGLPWFGVPFGRDSLIAALQLLPFASDVAKGTLRTMAKRQGTKKDSWRDEEPGKIMHEIRFGELVNTGQIPFSPYFGTIDATPLFLVLLSEYMKWTGDHSLFTELETNVEAALNWVDTYGDRDGDGFVEYHQEAAKGIANQGWKDSGDSIVHRDGSLGESPIALSEVQGYVYHAKVSMAQAFEDVGKPERGKELRDEAKILKEQFDKAFWMPEQRYYALALDKDKRQVGTVTSNPGHVLMSGMMSPEKAQAVSEVLVSDKLFSGFGIRTMGEGETGYNPMSYHNGTVWPHDNSLVILGMSRTGNVKAASKVMKGLIRSAASFDYDRLPELFCGYSASRGNAVSYPVACSPQAWAAGAPLLMVQAMLGLFPDALSGEVALNPYLPEGVNQLTVEQMQIGNGELDLTVTRNAQGDCNINVKRNTTGLTIKQ